MQFKKGRKCALLFLNNNFTFNLSYPDCLAIYCIYVCELDKLMGITANENLLHGRRMTVMFSVCE